MTGAPTDGLALALARPGLSSLSRLGGRGRGRVRTSHSSLSNGRLKVRRLRGKQFRRRGGSRRGLSQGVRRTPGRAWRTLVAKRVLDTRTQGSPQIEFRRPPLASTSAAEGQHAAATTMPPSAVVRFSTCPHLLVAPRLGRVGSEGVVSGWRSGVRPCRLPLCLVLSHQGLVGLAGPRPDSGLEDHHPQERLLLLP